MAGNMELPRTIEECDQILKFIEENVEDVKAAFAIFDKNGDGTIATKALLAVMRSLGLNPTEDEVDNMINEVDIDGNGVVDFIEFMLMMNKMWSNVDEAIREAFKIFDSDGSGAIDLEEFRTVMTSQGAADITETEVQDIIQQADVDGDGQIDLEEFVQMLNN